MSITNRWIGVRLEGGRYTIVGRIGQGNMGEVFLARDDHLGVDVVVKFPVKPTGPAGDPAFLERFEREIRALIRLSHPHVVKVIDVGRHDGHPYIVMQYLEGGSLKDRTGFGPDGNPLPMHPATLAGWLPDVARALDFIHAQGFVHRDVKPANILFDGHSNAFLGDFGIMKALTAQGIECDASSLTAPGFMLGTPNYVAPEVVMGRAADGRADQYALAMTVHEMLCGTNVMAGPSPSATVVNQINQAPPLLREFVAGVPDRLSQAVHRALAKDPLLRFENCTAFAHEALAEVPSVSGVLTAARADLGGSGIAPGAARAVSGDSGSGLAPTAVATSDGSGLAPTGGNVWPESDLDDDVAVLYSPDDQGQRTLTC
jgi:serine/threonine protein kinase